MNHIEKNNSAEILSILECMYITESDCETIITLDT